MTDGKSTLTFVIQILTIAFLIACLSIILPIRQSQLERYPFQDGNYSLRSVSNENGQYDITLVLAEGTDITEAKSVSVSEKPNDGAQYEAVKQRHHVEVKVKRLCDEGLKAARHLAPQLHVEPEDDICADSVTKVEGDKRHDRRSKS